MTTVTPPSRFVGLHAHSHFSTSDGLGLPQEHIDFALENGMDALALTEHGNVNSYCHAHQHAKELKKQGRSFRYVPGVEAYYHPDLEEWARTNAAAKEARDEARRQKQHVTKEEDDPGAVAENEDESKDVSKWFDPIKRRHHLVLLPTSRRGLENIFTLVSRSYKEGFYRFPRIDRKMLKQHGEDVVVTSACIGGPLAHDAMYELRDLQGSELNASALDDPARMDRVLARTMNTYDQLADAVGRDHVFAELQFNSLSQQHVVNRVLLQMHMRHGVQLSAAADSHYCRPELWAEREIYKMLGRLNYDQIDPSILPKDKTQLKCELYPKNAGQMWESYRRYCEGWDFYDDALVKDAIERTWHIAHDMIGDVEPDTSVKLPTSLVRPGTTAFSMLVDMCKEGLVMRGLHVRPAYVARLRHELGIIKEIAVKKGTDFSLYFITMKAVVDVADKSQLVGCGRGSAAGSLINYVLGVTSVDPLRYGLIFERFLSPARAEWPDVDSDFADRDRLITDLKDRFGAENVLPVSNFNTFQLRSLIKDLGRLYNVPWEEVNELTRTVEAEVKYHVIDAGENKSLFQLKYDDCMKHSPRFKAFMEKYPEVGSRIKVLYKQNKSIGRHAGGVLIAEGLDRKMPVISVRGEFQTPWVEGLQDKFLGLYGFLKFDLLGLETLRIIQRTIELILQRSGVDRPTWTQVKAWYDEHLHPDRLDFDDQRVYENVYHAGKWAGIFQFTSCFAQGTQVSLANGECASIENIAIGTMVRSFDSEAGQFVEKQVTAVHDNGSKKCIELQFDDGRTLVCTADHLFLTRNRGWVRAGDLTDEDDVVEDVA